MNWQKIVSYVSIVGLFASGLVFAGYQTLQNNPSQLAQASTNVQTELKPGQTGRFFIKYMNGGDTTMEGAVLESYIGSNLIVNQDSFQAIPPSEIGDDTVDEVRNNYGNYQSYAIDTNTLLDENVGNWGYKLNYSPKSAVDNSPNTPGGDSNGSQLDPFKGGIVFFEADLNPDILSEPKPTNPNETYEVGDVLESFNNEGVFSKLTSDNNNSGIESNISIKIGEPQNTGPDPNGDKDGDGILNKDEDTDNDGDPTNDDTDNDGDPNYDDTDSDNDGIPDSVECTTSGNCEDTDNDGTPDYLDQDSDGDGIPDVIENICSDGSSGQPCDTDGDGTPDYKDTNSDGDGESDAEEGGNELNCDYSTYPPSNCSSSDLPDVDGDGILEYQDPDEQSDSITLNSQCNYLNDECQLYFVGFDDAQKNWNDTTEFNTNFPYTQKYKDGKVDMVFDNIKNSQGNTIPDGSTCKFHMYNYGTGDKVSVTDVKSTQSQNGTCEVTLSTQNQNQNVINYYRIVATATDQQTNEKMKAVDTLVLKVGA
jgi:hypothetical protein